MFSVKNLAVFGFVAVAQASYPVIAPSYPVFSNTSSTSAAASGYPVKPTPTDYPVYTTTEIVKEYTTYCPEATTVVQGNKTYTVSSATTLTITDCPCTHVTTYPGTYTTITIGTTTTVCPEATTITTGGKTYPVTASGTVTLPICTSSIVPKPSYPASAPPAETYPASAPATYSLGTPLAPYPTASVETSGYASGTTAAPSATAPVTVPASGASSTTFGFGAMVAGLIAMIL